jgi:tetratricopeptide (TPR) repeat protein
VNARPALALFSAWLALAPLAAADFLFLKDGRFVQDKPLSRAPGGIEIQYANGKVFVADALVDSVLIEGEIAPPASDEEKENAAKGLVRFEGHWMPEKRRTELVAKRVEEKKKQFKELAAHREWRNRYKDSTKHFAFEYTIPPAIYGRYRDLMEAYFAEFAKQWKLAAPANLAPLPVCLHIDYDAMLQITGVGYGVLGYFRYVKPWECNFFYDRLDPSLTEEVMFHETNHYLQKLIDLDFSFPHFPGESLAEYYGASHWNAEKKQLSTGLVLEGRLVEVQADIQGGQWMKLEKLVDAGDMYEHYTWGWALVHFLMNDARYKPKFQRFVTALPTAKDIKRVEVGADNLRTCEPAEVWSAFRRYLDLKDDKAVLALETQWHAYVKNELELVTASGLEKAAQRASSMGMPIKAKRLFQEAIDKGSTNALTYHRYAQLLDRDKESTRALELWKKAVELDPLNADFYAAMGRAMAHKGNQEEAKRLRKLAREIDPDDTWLVVEDELDDESKSGK